MVAITALEFQPSSPCGCTVSSGWYLPYCSTTNSPNAPVMSGLTLEVRPLDRSPGGCGEETVASGDDTVVSFWEVRCSAPFSPTPSGSLLSCSVASLSLPERHPGNGYDVMHEQPGTTVV